MPRRKKKVEEEEFVEEWDNVGDEIEIEEVSGGGGDVPLTPTVRSRLASGSVGSRKAYRKEVKEYDDWSGYEGGFGNLGGRGSGSGGRRGDVVEDERDILSELEESINKDSVEEIKELIVHQLVVSYNLYRSLKELSEYALSVISKTESELEKIEKIYALLEEREGEKKKKGGDVWLYVLLSLILVLQVAGFVFLFLFR